MRSFLTIAMCLALWVAPALGQPIDALRGELTAARQAASSALIARQALADEHEALAATIGALKAQPSILPGVRNGALDDKLKEAHALSERLAAKDREVEAAQARVEATRNAYLAGLDQAIAAQRANLGSLPVSERKAAFAALTALVDERGRVSASVAPARSARVELPGVDGESPDELRDLADETQDHAEKVNSTLKSLEARLDELRSRRRMLRSAQAFRRDDLLFAENTRVRQTVSARRPGEGEAVRAPSRGEGSPTAAGGGADVEAGGQAEPPPNAPQAGGAPDGDRAGAGGEGEGAGAGDDFNGAPGADPEAPAPPPADEAEGDFDNDGALDVGDGFVDPAALPAPGVGASGGVNLGQSFVVEDALDPTLLSGDLAGLGPEALADHIRAVEAQKAKLARTAKELAKRKKALEERAKKLEGED